MTPALMVPSAFLAADFSETACSWRMFPSHTAKLTYHKVKTDVPVALSTGPVTGSRKILAYGRPGCLLDETCVPH